MQKLSVAFLLGVLSISTFCAPALAAPDNLSTKKTIETSALDIFMHSMSLRAPAKINPPSLVQFTASEWETKLFDMIDEEKLTGIIAYQYLQSLLQDSNFLINQTVKVKSVLPSLLLSNDQNQSILLQLETQTAALKSPKNVIAQASEADGFNLGIIFADLKKSFSQLPKFIPYKNELLGSTNLVQEMILGQVDSDDCYQNNPSCMYGSNQGLIQYLSRALNQDHQLILDTLRFSLRITQINNNNPHSGDFSVFDHATKYNIWKIALDSVGQNPDRAMQVITVFGHDVCCNGIDSLSKNTDFPIGVLNEFHPNSGSDASPFSHLFSEGSLNGVKISRRLEMKFKKLNAKYRQLNGQDTYFRAGYYHTYGGMLTARELLSHGLGYKDGIKFSSMISEMLGYFYKRFTLPLNLDADASTLWDLSGQNEKCLTKKIPEGWNNERFEKAKVNLEIAVAMIELTQEQHRQGAEFAYRVYRELN